VKEVSGVCKTFRNAAPKNETGLVSTDKLGNERLQPVSENFGQAFYGGVLESDRPEVSSPMHISLFWQEDKIRAIDTFKISIAGIEIAKEVKNIRIGNRLGSLVKRGAKAIKVRACIVVHKHKFHKDI
jgi:hypothetical protein